MSSDLSPNQAINLHAFELLAVWEHCLNQPVLQRALILLLAACPDKSTDELAELSIGQRDLHLLQMRESLFGSRLVNTTRCPDCTERIEWESQVSDFLLKPGVEHLTGSEFDMQMDGYHIRFRLPNSLDIAAVINSDKTDSAQRNLMSHCLVKSEKSGKNYHAEQLPEQVINAISQRIEDLDPLADIRISLKCPACAHQLDVLFDISRFLWTEINDWAERMLQTIHTLASGYGWSETEILNLSPVRRQLYLGMLST